MIGFREGTTWMWKIMERLVRGDADTKDIDMLWQLTKEVEGHTICALGDASKFPVVSLFTFLSNSFKGTALRRFSYEVSSR